MGCYRLYTHENCDYNNIFQGDFYLYGYNWIMISYEIHIFFTDLIMKLLDESDAMFDHEKYSEGIQESDIKSFGLAIGE